MIPSIRFVETVCNRFDNMPLYGGKTCKATTDALHAHDGNSTAAFVGVFCTQSHHDKLSEGRLTDHALNAFACSQDKYALSRCWSRMYRAAQRRKIPWKPAESVEMRYGTN